MRSLALALAVLAACGDDAGTQRDAGSGDDGGSGDGDADVDAMIDADPNVRGTVTVHLVDKNNAPLAGVHVIFIDTDSTVTDAVTNTNGVVTGSVYPGANLTAIHETADASAYSLTTVLALNPDDDITLVSADTGASLAEDPFSTRAVPLPSADIASLVKSGSTSVVTTLRAHGLTTGDLVTIADVIPIGYNGTHTVTGAPTATTFTIAYNDNTPGGQGIAFEALPFTVSFTSYAGATEYEVHTPCGPANVGTQLTPTVRLRAGCAAATIDVLVYAKNSSTNEIAYAYQPNVAFTSGGNVTITDTWHTLTTVDATYSNVPTTVTEIVSSRHTPYIRGAAPVSATCTPGGSACASPQLFTHATASLPTAHMRTVMRCPAGNDCIPGAQQTLAERVDGTAATYAVDVGATLLPWVSANWVKETATLDMTVTGTAPIDMFHAYLRYGRGQTIYTWRVFGPTPGDLTFPTLPATAPGDPTIRLCPGNPCTDTQSAYQVWLCESDAVGGYRDAVKNPYVSLGTCESATSTANRPVGGMKNRVSRFN